LADPQTVRCPEANRALRALIGIGLPAVPALTRIVETSDAETADRVIWALGMIGPGAAESVPALIRAYKARGPATSFQYRIVESLGRIGPAARESEHILIDSLRSDLSRNAETAPLVVWALARIGATSVAVACLQGVVRGDRGLGAAAIDLLGRLGSDARAAIPDLRRVMNGSRDGDLWAHAAAALSRIDPTDGSALPVLIESTKDYPWVAVTALRRLGPAARSALPAVLGVLERGGVGRGADDGVATSEVIRALVWIDPEGRQVVPALVRVLRGQDHEGQAYAADALGLVGGNTPEAATALVQGIKAPKRGNDGPYDLADCCASALVRLGPKAEAAVPELVQLLGSGNRDTQKAAMIALAAIGPAATPAVGPLTRCFGDEVLQPYAVAALGRIGPAARAAAPALADIAKRSGPGDNNSALRVQAVLALLRIDPDTGEQLARKLLQTTRDRFTRAIVSHTLGLKSAEAREYVEMQLASLRKFLSLQPWETALDYKRPPCGADPAEYTIRQIRQFGAESETATPLLTDLLRYPDPYIRASAAEALRLIHPK